ncbi:MFS transporter [Speluncibacter jeojiensis]|uniref:MFS transporter n=1 Tax=Speluncibacter jeojiensis TaxID=2710754 RepID=A0A9X4LZV1_9ACTN|nr:MFS transporter [Corynebacteriales bacterium D3-21]
MTTPAALRPQRTPNVIVAVLGLCGIVVALMQTLIVPLVPVLPTILHSSASNASWAITATLLAGAVVTPIAGRLGDMFGKRLVLVASMALLTIGSVLCAVSSSLIVVLVGRVFQGLAMGAIALGISIMRDELPAERVGSAMAVMSATLGVGGAIGMPVAAIIAEKSNWHVLFWVSAGLGLICVLALLAVIPESPVKTPGKFDYVGAFGLSAALVALLLPISKGGDWGWTSGPTVGLVIASVVIFLAWGWYELRVSTPLVDLRVSSRRQVLFTNLSSVAVGFAMYGMSLIPSQILMAPKASGYGMGLSMIEAGLIMAPSGLVMFFCSPVSARISARSGPRTSLGLGAVIIGLGYVFGLFLQNSPWEIMVSTMIIGAGIGIAYAAMPALIMGAVPITETAAANGLNSLMRAVGTSLSAAVVSTVLANMTISLGAFELPSQHGFTVSILISIGAAVISLLLTLLIPRRQPVETAASAPKREKATVG